MASAIRNLLKKSNTAVGIVNGIRADWLECKRSYWSFVRKGKFEEYLNRHQVYRLQLGTGNNPLNGWLNTDLFPNPAKEILYLDASRKFPFADASFDYVLSEHHIEHLGFREALFMLRECHRVLKPRGKIRVATPDLRALSHLMMNIGNPDHVKFIQFATDHLIQEEYLPRQEYYGPAFVINNSFYNPNWHHKFLYDSLTLTRCLEQSGFSQIEEFHPGESQDENLKGVEGHGKELSNEEFNQLETMVLEGIKG